MAVLPYFVGTSDSDYNPINNATNIWEDFTGVSQTEAMNQANRDIASARNAMEIEEAAKAREFSASEADKLRDWQNEQIGRQLGFEERMSNSAVSRRMADLKKSGINPILAGKFDASSPSGAAGAGAMGATAKANSQGAIMQKKPSGVEQLNSALSVMQNVKNVEKTQADIALKENQANVIEPASKVGKDVGNTYEEAKKVFNDVTGKIGSWIGNSAFDITQKAGKTIDTLKSFTKKSKYDHFKQGVTDHGQVFQNNQGSGMYVPIR